MPATLTRFPKVDNLHTCTLQLYLHDFINRADELRMHNLRHVRYCGESCRLHRDIMHPNTVSQGLLLLGVPLTNAAFYYGVIQVNAPNWYVRYSSP